MNAYFERRAKSRTEDENLAGEKEFCPPARLPAHSTPFSLLFPSEPQDVHSTVQSKSEAVLWAKMTLVVHREEGRTRNLGKSLPGSTETALVWSVVLRNRRSRRRRSRRRRSRRRRSRRRREWIRLGDSMESNGLFARITSEMKINALNLD